MDPILAKLDLNTEWIKYSILIAATPLWWPFLRELWKELNDILAEEGGLLGAKPDEKELAEIRRRRAAKQADLMRELREERRAPQGRRRRLGGGRGFGVSELRRPGGVGGAGRRSGFGPPR